MAYAQTCSTQYSTKKDIGTLERTLAGQDLIKDTTDGVMDMRKLIQALKQIRTLSQNECGQILSEITDIANAALKDKELPPACTNECESCNNYLRKCLMYGQINPRIITNPKIRECPSFKEIK